MPLLNKSEWKEFLNKHPNAHILQDAAWGELKGGSGWEVERVVMGEVGAQILFKPLPLGYCVAYIPRGPVVPPGWEWGTDAGEYSFTPPCPPNFGGKADSPRIGGRGAEGVNGYAGDGFWAEVDAICRPRRAVFLKVEPDLWQDAAAQGHTSPPGFRPSLHNIQPARTIIISLQEGEDEILGRMKSKTRYNIRLAGRKEVVVRQSSNVEEFYETLTGTAGRAEFGIHTLEYYQRAFELFAPSGKCQLFTAEYKSQPLASVMVFARGERSWYFYGASSPEHRDLMPTYLVQWEAMRWAKEQGCTSYDLWGVPDEDFATLEDQFMERHDGLWSVYRFKRGFGGQLKRTRGPWDRVYKPTLYAAYRWWAGRGE